jgi:hypothetical protein
MAVLLHAKFGLNNSWFMTDHYITHPDLPDSVQMQSFNDYSPLGVHEFAGTFQGKPAHFRMTSVIGHVTRINFPKEYDDWGETDPASLFAAPIVSAPIFSSEEEKRNLTRYNDPTVPKVLF